MAPVMVPFTNGKGGVGKTALACSYAVARAREGADVVLMDVNEEQRTATAWCEVRDHNSLLPKIRVEAGNPRQALEMVGRCEVLIVDTPGWTDKSTLALAKRSTFMVIPTSPNPTYDLAATVRLLHGLKAEGIESWRMGVVLSRFAAEDKVRREEEQFAREYLSQAGYSALDGCVRNSPAFSSSLAVGYGMTEVDGASLVAEAANLMEGISKAVASAQRRLSRQNSSERTQDREKGGRDR